ncbi:hypothetical protein [Nocardioides panacisoli]|uniref:Collagen-like protein n=1 Tax=Nocardioides panacisoli TaxID=627624 RepID=A0ABP7I633_9ACTN
MRNKSVGAALVGASLFVISSAAYASIPASDGSIQGCYAKSDGLTGGLHSKGDLRVIDSGACRSYETPLSWNQRGVPGPTGPIGPAGPTGPPGPAGPGSQAPVYYAARPFSFDGFETLPASRRYTVVLSKSLPAGSYLVQADAMFSAETEGGVDCQLRSGDAFQVGYGYVIPATAPNTTVSIIWAISHASGAVDLACRTSNGMGIATATILATQVASVS